MYLFFKHGEILWSFSLTYLILREQPTKHPNTKKKTKIHLIGLSGEIHWHTFRDQQTIQQKTVFAINKYVKRMICESYSIGR